LAILTYNSRGLLSPSDIKNLVEQSLDADKASDIVTIDLKDQNSIADYMIVASGTSSRHVAALAEKLKDRLEIRGLKGVRIEGIAQADWVAIDAGDVMVHIFRPEVRSFYNIEKMWSPIQHLALVSEPVRA
jgi:ribosome-associated protein